MEEAAVAGRLSERGAWFGGSVLARSKRLQGAQEGAFCRAPRKKRAFANILSLNVKRDTVDELEWQECMGSCTTTGVEIGRR